MISVMLDIIKKLVFIIVFTLFLFQINSIASFITGIYIIPILLVISFIPFAVIKLTKKNRKKQKLFDIQKKITIYLTIALAACLGGVLFYATFGLTRVFITIFIVLSISFMLMCLKKTGKSSNITYFVLLTLMILLTVLNEYQFSFQTKSLEVEMPEGAKTVFILTNDDSGSDNSNPDTLIRISNYLSEKEVPATFFMVAKAFEDSRWSEAIEVLKNNEHEIAFHGYDHRIFEFGRFFYFMPFPSYEKQLEVFKKSQLLIGNVAGFRAPLWRENLNTQLLLEHLGFSYNSGKLGIFTPKKPFYRSVKGRYVNILNVQNSGEFTWLFGPNILRLYEYHVNKQIFKLLIKKSKIKSIPIVFGSHINRLESPIAFELFCKLIETINQDPEIVFMDMKHFVEMSKKN